MIPKDTKITERICVAVSCMENDYSQRTATMQQEQMDGVSLIEQAHCGPKGEHAVERANGEECTAGKPSSYELVPTV